MNVNELVEKVKADSSYTDFLGNSPKSFLAHIFMMSDGDTMRDLQVGYYNPENKKMTSFSIDGEKIIRMPEQDIFQKPGNTVKELDMSVVKAEQVAVKEGVEKVVKDKYNAEGSKKIFILQNIDAGQVWNVTYLTTKFSTINFKVDSSSMEILSDEEVQLIDMNRSN